MTTCTKIFTDIPFAHRQPNHTGHCRFIHGHNWSFEFEFVATEKDACGFVFDFGKLGPLKDWLKQFDHALVLNTNDPLILQKSFGDLMAFTCAGAIQNNLMMVEDCSCEGMAELALKMGEIILQEISGGRVSVARVTVFEDSKNSATAIAPVKMFKEGTY